MKVLSAHGKCSLLLLLWAIFVPFSMWAQNLRGRVTDAKTGQPLSYVNVHYENSTVGTNTDYEGHFSVRRLDGQTLTFSFVGYEKHSVLVEAGMQSLEIQLKPTSVALKGTVVRAKRKRYSRKDNPAVALMRKVIAAKKESDVKRNYYFQYDQYRKTTFSINEFSEDVLKEGSFKKMPFIKDHVEMCPETGKLILPVSVMEEASRYIYRKDPKSEKTIITGKREKGVNELFNTGDIMNEVIADCFTDVNIYHDNVRLLQHPFISPLSSHYAIGFYHYFLGDTLLLGGDSCIEVDFAPANPQDFGFTGSLYIHADSTYRVRKATLNIPRRSDVNYVEDLRVDQEFLTLPDGGGQMLLSDKMLVQLKLTDFLTKFQVERATSYKNYSTTEIPSKEFKIRGSQYIEPDAMMRDMAFWEEQRAEPLTRSEGDMDKFLQSMKEMKHFKWALLVAKAFVENFVETSTDAEHPSKVDLGPVNTTITQNFVDGLRLRASAQTTANLNRHIFAKGYLAYGFRDQRWKGLGELTYSFNAKGYLPREFPVHNLIASYQSDVVSPSDKFMPTDKDNVFTSFKWTKVDQMMYYRRFRLRYEREFHNGLRLEGEFRRERTEGTGKLFYQPLDAASSPSQDNALHSPFFNTSDLKLGFFFQPHAKYINTKQRRITVNRDSPCFTLYHTFGLNAFGGRHVYHFTEASIFKRVWVPGAGKIDFRLQGGAQWSRVPWPLLIMPAANLSYIKESGTFAMLDNMEFLNDRYASLMLSWDLNGKIFNRIPLLRRLKWREFIGCNMLWGTLTSRNNPFLHPQDSRLYYFPGRFQSDGQFRYSSYVMDPDKPYCELIVGVHNVFKLLHVEMVRRMNYLDNDKAHKWGLRLMLRMTF